MRQLIVEDELRFDFIVLTQLWPLTDEEVSASVQTTGRLVVVEEGVATYGVSAALIAAVAQRLDRSFVSRAIGMRPLPIPCSRHLEDQVLPTASGVIEAVRRMCR
jgi:pyruvate/2-oxoglutarate/acetoin dehydrogenase E1 component